MQGLEQLNDKLDVLLKKYSALLAENKRLKSTLEKQAGSLGVLQEKSERSDDELIAARMGNSIVTGKEKAGMRKQLDSVINEIDKILITLNG